ncbi:MAG: 23S rRNA (guanosine(2251)-2'-O)-methyltransferase RlmB [Thermodesulfobacteriota bacterium]
MKTEILYGVHPVFEALRAARRRFHEIFICRGRSFRRLEGITASAKSKSVPVRELTPDRMTSLAGSEFHQGVAARVDPYPSAELESVLTRTDPFLLMLDSVVDPNNLGALVRTALCAGVDGVILPRDRSASPLPSVSKASAGALEHTALVRITNLARTIEIIKQHGFWIAGLDRAAEKPVFESDLKGPLAVIIGGEEKGIRPLVKQHCDFLVRIPQVGPLDSLNASAAGAVVMYEAFRQRRSTSA